MSNVVFKDELCDAKVLDSGKNIFELVCHKGKLRVEGTIATQFWAYHHWCKDCKRKHIVDRKELKKGFDDLAKNIAKEFE